MHKIKWIKTDDRKTDYLLKQHLYPSFWLLLLSISFYFSFHIIGISMGYFKNIINIYKAQTETEQLLEQQRNNNSAGKLLNYHEIILILSPEINCIGDCQKRWLLLRTNQKNRYRSFFIFEYTPCIHFNEKGAMRQNRKAKAARFSPDKHKKRRLEGCFSPSGRIGLWPRGAGRCS